MIGLRPLPLIEYRGIVAEPGEPLKAALWDPESGDFALPVAEVLNCAEIAGRLSESVIHRLALLTRYSP